MKDTYKNSKLYKSLKEKGFDDEEINNIIFGMFEQILQEKEINKMFIKYIKAIEEYKNR
jgi:uncharacterized protein Smg (DUF494 family)